MGNRKHFKRRFEFYYQSVAVYAVALILYAVVRGTFAEGEFKIVFKDPIVYAFILVLIYSIAVLVFNILFQRDIVLTDESIVFKNRFDSKAIKLSDLEWIRLGKAKRMRVRGGFKVIRLKLKGQMRTIKINPIYFHDEVGMMQAFTELGVKTGLLAEDRKNVGRKNV
jgi:hypothetical protein